MKVYREWRISGDTAWLRGLWPSVKTSLDYCIATWDPRRKGALEEPHHNTYDIEFWGPDGMCTSFYLGALRAAVRHGHRRSATTVPVYDELLEQGPRASRDGALQRRVLRPEGAVEGPRTPGGPRTRRAWSASTRRRPGPSWTRKGPSTSTARAASPTACSGAWMAAVCGVGEILDRREDGQPPARGPPLQPQAATSPPTPTRSARATPSAPRAACCSAPGRRAARCPCPSSTRTRSGPASSTRWPRTSC